MSVARQGVKGGGWWIEVEDRGYVTGGRGRVGGSRVEERGSGGGTKGKGWRDGDCL